MSIMQSSSWMRAVSLGFALCALISGANAAAAEPARVIVKLRNSAWTSAQSAQATADGLRRVKALSQRAGVTLRDSRQLAPRLHLARASGISSAELARRLSAQSDVEFAVVDERREASALSSSPNDPLLGDSLSDPYPQVGQWYLRAPVVTTPTPLSTDTPSAIDAAGAWAITPGSRAVVVAVLDTGIRYDHVDLQGKLLPGYNMISSPVIAGNGVGRSDNPSDLGDYITQADKDNNPTLFANCSVQSSSWHGTKVAGLVGAVTNNGTGMAGTAPDVQILPVRVLGKCGGYDSDIIDGMRWAAGLQVGTLPINPFPAKVLNLSLGSETSCSAAYTNVISELTARNVVVVAAAGNTVGGAVETPGRCANVLAVTALRNSGSKVGYASVGPEVFIAAPGGNCGVGSGCQFPILSTTNTGTTVPIANASSYTDAYSASVGTSFSAPLLAGTVAMMFSVNPDLTLASVKAHLTNSARPFLAGSAISPSVSTICQAPQDDVTQSECVCTSTTCGVGMLDAAGAVARAAAAATTPVPVISTLNAVPVVGQALTLSDVNSRPGPGATDISSAQWTVLDGGGIVSSSGATGSSLTLTPTAAGAFTVRLSVTDNAATPQTRSVDVTISVAQTQSITEGSSTSNVATASSGGGGGGGGAVDLSLLALLALAASHSVSSWLSLARRPALRAR